MTPEQKCKVLELRKNKLGYGEIAKQLHVSKTAIYNFIIKEEENKTFYCKYCGKSFIQTPKRKKKIFCCRECKDKWWIANQTKLRTKQYLFKCVECGCEFDRYKHKEQLFCSAECYNKHKTKGGEQDE